MREKRERKWWRIRHVQFFFLTTYLSKILLDAVEEEFRENAEYFLCINLLLMIVLFSLRMRENLLPLTTNWMTESCDATLKWMKIHLKILLTMNTKETNKFSISMSRSSDEYGHALMTSEWASILFYWVKFMVMMFLQLHKVERISSLFQGRVFKHHRLRHAAYVLWRFITRGYGSLIDIIENVYLH